MKKNGQKLIALVLLWLLIGYVLYPALRTVVNSFTTETGRGLVHYISIVNTPSHRTALINTFILGLLTVIVCGIVGTTLAFLMRFYQFPLKKMVHQLLLLPIVLPGLIITYAFVQLYGESGLITKTIQLAFNLKAVPFALSGLGGILFIHAYTQYVYFYMNVSVAIGHIDRCAIEAAKNLGATKWQVFKDVIIPFIKPALISASIVTFMTGIGSFAAPSILGGNFRVMTTQILLAKANNYMPLAAAQVMCLVMIGMSYMLVLKGVERKASYTPAIKKVAIKPKKINNVGVFLAFLLILSILLPILTIFVLSFVKPGTWMVNIYPQAFSFDNYIKVFTNKYAVKPMVNSLKMGAMTVGICAILSISGAFIITKTTIKFRKIIELLIMLPWAIPASAVAINMINAFSEPSIFTFNRILLGSYILLPIAYCVKLLPMMTTTTKLSFENINHDYLDASKSMGASAWQTFKRVMIPLISPGVLAGGSYVFIRVIGEYTLSAFLSTASNKPISMAVVNNMFEYKIGLSMAYGTVVVLITFGGSLLFNYFKKD